MNPIISFKTQFHLQIEGRVLYSSDKGFQEAIKSTMFNKKALDRNPDVIVYPKSVQDIIHTLHYAKYLGKKISICSGGHSWSANHIRNGSILINMSHFNQYEVNKEKMIAKAGPAVGGSILLVELFKQGLFFPAGHCRGVCLGGYLLQGGFAWNGRKLGMACESVIGMDIVTAEGEYLHASENENPDLFWAARGSGGGFLGVVVRFHLKLYKRPKYSGMMSHIFNIKYLEDVYEWAYQVGPSVPNSVEFQIIMSQKTLHYFTPGMEVMAPIFADTKEELEKAMEFMQHSPIKKRAYLRLPFLEMNMNMMYSLVMSHYPEEHHWAVDNMWTKAPISELMPHLKLIAATLPPPPAHCLWLNWQPQKQRQDMAFSMEDNIYIALYGVWKSPKDTHLYDNWASEQMKNAAHLATGIQLADEGLHKRTAPFVSSAHLQKLDTIRQERDKNGLFHAWHSRP